MQHCPERKQPLFCEMGLSTHWLVVLIVTFCMMEQTTLFAADAATRRPNIVVVTQTIRT